MALELASLSVELASIIATGKQLKRPIKIPRPGETGDTPGKIAHDKAQDGIRKAVSVLSQTSKTVRR